MDPWYYVLHSIEQGYIYTLVSNVHIYAHDIYICTCTSYIIYMHTYMHIRSQGIQKVKGSWMDCKM